METPKTDKELRQFISMINFYQAMFQSRAHLMVLLTSLTKVAPQSFHKMWNEEHNKAFEAIKAMVVKDALLTHSDLNKEFLIEMDALNLQLGVVIKQDGKSIAFYSCWNK